MPVILGGGTDGASVSGGREWGASSALAGQATPVILHLVLGEGPEKGHSSLEC